MLQPHGRKTSLFCSQTAKNWSACMQDRQTMIFMNLRSTSKPTGSQRLRKTYQFPCTWHPAVFYRYRKCISRNLTHALENIWLSQSKYVIHKEVAISQVFQDNMTYDDLFYMGRFDFVVYEKQGKRNCRFWRSNLMGKSILRMRWCRSATGRKMPSVRHTIWRLYGWRILMPEGIIILREF